jgi:hypothetical protein
MTSTKEDIDTEFFAMVDWVPTVPCEGNNHAIGTLGHVPGMPAEFVMALPCNCYPPILKCRGWVEYARTHHPTINCEGCGIKHRIAFVTFTPITIP